MNDVRFPLAKEHRQRNGSVWRSRNGAQGMMIWHRRLGLVTAVIVLLLAVTGILLNHAHRLGLDELRIEANWVLRWYGFSPATPVLSYRAGGRWVVWSGSRLHIDDREIVKGDTAPVGVEALDDGVVAVAFPQSVILVAQSGEILERIGGESLPGTLERVGTSQRGSLVVKTAQGLFETDSDMLGWHRASLEPVWSSPEEPPARVRGDLTKAQRGSGISVERILQDLHSGRIFGTWGPWFMDAVAVAFIVIAVTGLYCWWARRGALPRLNGKQGRDD
jgi:uncharacterized iron-regulated membrane protein